MSQRETTRRILVLIGAVALAALLAGRVVAESDAFEEPAEAAAGSPDADVVGSGTPVEAGSQDPSSITTGSESPDADLVGSGEPNADADSQAPVADTSAPAPDTLPSAGSYDRAAEREDATEIRTEDGSPSTPSDSVAAARSALAMAQQEVDALDHAYADMMQRDYPRGEERQRLIDQRAAAHAALGAAQQRYDQLVGASPGDSTDGDW
jgi:hypothetical protein